MAQSKYDKEEIIVKLSRKGLKPKYDAKKHCLTHFEQPKRVVLGIKCLGYVDFLQVPVIKKG